jgi:hypothetical protein
VKSASWCTNVGNERGDILISMTTSESLSNLSRMADGLKDRYENALQPALCCTLTETAARRVKKSLNSNIFSIAGNHCWSVSIRGIS